MRRLPFSDSWILLLLVPLSAAAQTRPTSPAAPVHAVIRNTTRAETWRFFDPPAGGGQPDYTFIANRLLAGVDVRRSHLDLSAALQYVQFGHLPEQASGPGPFGTGAQYFSQAGSRTSHQVYLRTLYLRLKDPARGLTAQLGRFGYASGAESPSGDPAIEAVKRLRLDSRLIGEFEWSIYQRSFDGARADIDRKTWHGSAAWLQPTQGGFEERAGLPMTRVHVVAATVTAKPSASLKHTDWQGFVYRYDDTRLVNARPDNTRQTADRVDVHITTAGTSVVGVYPVAHAQLDVLGWFAWQTGDWYGQPHRAAAIATEVGYQRSSTAWRPWLRAGWARSTGDGNPTDDRHGTFFQLLPTARRYSLSTTYNLMNVSDGFVQLVARPRASVSVRADLHHLALSRAADLWYAGSGAGARTGTVFGFAGRPSNGATSLGTMVEGAADWSVTPHVSLNGYLGHLRGGGVVTGTFAGRTLEFGYVETIVSF